MKEKHTRRMLIWFMVWAATLVDFLLIARFWAENAYVPSIVTHLTAEPFRIALIKPFFFPLIGLPDGSVSSARFHRSVSANHTIACFSELSPTCLWRPTWYRVVLIVPNQRQNLNSISSKIYFMMNSYFYL